ncbi:apolipoprotein D-like [Cotesia glomerata]|uniref:Lipocalin/cytosolic fatty-acid binding domain-containing protein n=1 Tax=Cotesia glomerata TaxID=32391 RepID=A0AAV7IQB3_COTGL|nr:apolipoprotein D-like [Cotesia glomerata]KAH0555069.1 hypothetical protein KQX54_015072 [Cotesia glomerata]
MLGLFINIIFCVTAGAFAQSTSASSYSSSSSSSHANSYGSNTIPGSQTLMNGPCPDIVADRYELNSFSGRWYELERSINMYDSFDECQEIEWRETNTNSTILIFSAASVLTNETSTTLAEVVPTEKGFMFTYLLPILGRISNEHQFIGTDFDTYLINWSCENVDDNKHIERTYVFSRHPKLTRAIKHAKRRAFRKYHLTLPKMIPRDFSNCTAAFKTYNYL